MYVRAKKSLGQHFLRDEEIAMRIVESLESVYERVDGGTNTGEKVDVLEVGAGTGVLTKYLLARTDVNLKVVEIDTDSVFFLRQTYPKITPNLLEDDFLQMNLKKFFSGEFMIVGNFPYNISSQIFFKVLDYTDQITQVVGMVQKEVGERLASPPGKKAYGILSVLLQVWYDIEYLFTVGQHVFSPPPKVQSSVIRLRRNSRTDLGCDQVLFKAVVKTCFNQRRKTIRNSLKPLLNGRDLPESAEIETLLGMRPEQLSVEQFVTLTLSVATL